MPENDSDEPTIFPAGSPDFPLFDSPLRLKASPTPALTPPPTPTSTFAEKSDLRVIPSRKTLASSSGSLELDLAISSAFVHPQHHRLVLKQFDLLLRNISELADGILCSVYEDTPEFLVDLEYPHLFIVLDDEKSPNFAKSLAYISKQKCVSVVIDGGYVVNSRRFYSSREIHQKNLPGVFQIICVLIATPHFIFVFDNLKLEKSQMFLYLKGLLEDSSVHKIFHRKQANFLGKVLDINPKNFHDVLCVEKKLEKKFGLSSLGNYSLRKFALRYKTKSRIFSEFPAEDFFYRPLEFAKIRISCSNVAKLPRKSLMDCLKQVVYLEKIRNIQIGLLWKKVVPYMEVKIVEDVFLNVELEDVDDGKWFSDKRQNPKGMDDEPYYGSDCETEGASEEI